MFVLKYRKRKSNFYKTFPREIQLFRFHRGRLAWRGCWARPRWGSGPWLSSRRAAPWRRSLHFRPFKQEKYFLCKKLKSRTNKQTRRWQRSYLSKLLKGQRRRHIDKEQETPVWQFDCGVVIPCQTHQMLLWTLRSVSYQSPPWQYCSGVLDSWLLDFPDWTEEYLATVCSSRDTPSYPPLPPPPPCLPTTSQLSFFLFLSQISCFQLKLCSDFLTYWKKKTYL